ncbi:MAG TPA: hypothetical protein VE176_01480, partial [Candidatus Limnocylindrales bacterium]|nr:hypothetical protein [Candidatus Limnocylindrales bacterium]
FDRLRRFTDCSRLRVKLRRAGTPFGVRIRHRGFVLWRTCSPQVRQPDGLVRGELRAHFL